MEARAGDGKVAGVARRIETGTGTLGGSEKIGIGAMVRGKRGGGSTTETVKTGRIQERGGVRTTASGGRKMEIDIARMGDAETEEGTRIGSENAGTAVSKAMQGGTIGGNVRTEFNLCLGRRPIGAMHTTFALREEVLCGLLCRLLL
ncbi:hypothetical protein BOTBODRAFT_585242 [Botryobasidium botryosum FD-172 SS1]|uniref:Uncharacterized protein n=1 Tax=Botryobasidium botryosum (strain FD-172 SS1) TaxID=930990 RepID=A0A067M8D0_BOTB1|nr:hypothetical protein BOTBODRAFT_585242 [Botryobasidium botryosum FD-172 SS1]